MAFITLLLALLSLASQCYFLCFQTLRRCIEDTIRSNHICNNNEMFQEHNTVDTMCRLSVIKKWIWNKSSIKKIIMQQDHSQKVHHDSQEEDLQQEGQSHMKKRRRKPKTLKSKNSEKDINENLSAHH